jgi:diadenosine tetraphosphate (Ap4A) HIT family hydrolase
MTVKTLLFILFVTCLLSANELSLKLQFYAYEKDVETSFNQECIPCTPSVHDGGTIAFTKHWNLIYWPNQAYLGRTLIVSKRHFGSYEEMSDEEAEEYRAILRLYLPALKKTFGVTHFNVAYLMNQAYRPQEVKKSGKPNPHFHWHVIPRYDGVRTFRGVCFEDPDFGNSFNLDRKQNLTGDFQKEAIQAIRSNLEIVYIKSGH